VTDRWTLSFREPPDRIGTTEIPDVSWILQNRSIARRILHEDNNASRCYQFSRASLVRLTFTARRCQVGKESSPESSVFPFFSALEAALAREAGTFGATRRERETRKWTVKRITRESKQARFNLCDVSLLARGARPAPLNGFSNKHHRIRLDCGRGLQLIASLRSSITCVIRHVTISAIRKRDVPRPLASFDRRAD